MRGRPILIPKEQRHAIFEILLEAATGSNKTGVMQATLMGGMETFRKQQQPQDGNSVLREMQCYKDQDYPTCRTRLIG